MRYDAIVVGVGLAGLTAALRLAEEGRRVLVLAKGVGATQLAPATIDVLGYDGACVDSPSAALGSFAAGRPGHPYARMAPETITAALGWFRTRVEPLRYVGDLNENLLLPTAVGVAKPSALVPETMAAGDLRSHGRFVIVGLRGLKDFYPAYAAANLRHASLPRSSPPTVRALELTLPLDGARDVGGLGFAAQFESADFRGAVAEQLKPLLTPGEHVGLPAVLGRRDPGEVWRDLQKRLEAPVFEIPTLPPSIPGMRLFETLRNRIRHAGGRVVIGDRVVGAETSGKQVTAVVAETAARTVAHQANSFLLATGGFASGGLELDSTGRVREQVFGLPVAGVPEHGRGFSPRYFDEHELSRAGLAVDARWRPVDGDGWPVYENLHVAGAALAGAEPWREKSGDGISLSSGYAAASAMLEEA